MLRNVKPFRIRLRVPGGFGDLGSRHRRGVTGNFRWTSLWSAWIADSGWREERNWISSNGSTTRDRHPWPPRQSRRERPREVRPQVTVVGKSLGRLDVDARCDTAHWIEVDGEGLQNGSGVASRSLHLALGDNWNKTVPQTGRHVSSGTDHRRAWRPPARQRPSPTPEPWSEIARGGRSYRLHVDRSRSLIARSCPCRCAAAGLKLANWSSRPMSAWGSAPALGCRGWLLGPQPDVTRFRLLYRDLKKTPNLAKTFGRQCLQAGATSCGCRGALRRQAPRRPRTP